MSGAYAIDPALQALGLRIFPIKITRGAKKWEKRPLTRNGHLDASADPSVFDWSEANGAGIVMGDGIYALDVDDVSQGSSAIEWIKAHCPDYKSTRAHRTPSGGYHIIYRLPQGWENLRTRQGVVKGLDTRGRGGWIAFGEGYEVVGGKDLQTLTTKTCEDLDAGHVDLQIDVRRAQQVNPEKVGAKLLAILRRSDKVRRRWAGETVGLVDRSRSSLDLSLAFQLAAHGMAYDEIVWVLLEAFKHGQARYHVKGHRAALRCAARAEASVADARIEDFKEPEELTPEEEAFAERTMQNDK